MKIKLSLINKIHSSRGDTIVEVLIAMTIIAFVLGTAYSLASRSTKNTTEARERVEALKLVEGQIEILKSKRPDLTSYHSTPPSFCFTPSDGKQYSSTDTNCTVSGPSYNLTIIYVYVPSGGAGTR